MTAEEDDNLKPLPLPFSNDPLNLMRYRSADNQYYILAFFYSDLDGLVKLVGRYIVMVVIQGKKTW
jgi:hypothetical protein